MQYNKQQFVFNLLQYPHMLVYITPLDDQCQNFTLGECTWEQCAMYTRVGNVTVCAEWVTVTSSDWGHCLGVCCSFNGNPQTYTTLQQCLDKNNLTAMIVGIVIGGVGFIVIITFIICINREKIAACWESFRQKFKGCCNCFKSAEIHPSKAEVMMEMVNNVVTTQTVVLKAKYSWSDCNTSDLQLIKSNNCAICLGDRPTIKLQCNHLYHYGCITKWKSKRESCPLCSSQDLKIVTVFCSNCFIKRHSQQLMKISNFEVESQLCSTCKK